MSGRRVITRVPLLFTLIAVAWAGLLPCRSIAGENTDDAPISWHTGSLFRRELERPVNVIRTSVTVREMIARLGKLHQVAILLDRRIDPDRIIDVQLTQTTLLEGLSLLAAQLDADIATVGSTVVIGPPQDVDRTLTLIRRMHDETRALHDPPAKPQAVDWSHRHTFAWEDLARPIDVLEVIADRGSVELEQADLVPHDLWAAGSLHDVTVPEALMLVLGQYDLACRISDDGRRAEIYREAGRITFEQRRTPRGMNAAEAADLVQREWPQAIVKVQGRQLHIEATALEHERIAESLNPARRRPEQTGDVSLGPLERRQFTFQVVRKPLSAVIRTLEANDMIVEYNAAALRAAGIDLDEKVSLKLEKASAAELFQALCEPLGIQYRINGKTVSLSPGP